jgi:hypothetical protein
MSLRAATAAFWTRKEVERKMRPGDCPMGWPVPKYSIDQVNEAGRVLVDADRNSDHFGEAITIIDSFRASHYMPLNTFQTTLRAKTEQYSGAIVVQRIKR